MNAKRKGRLLSCWQRRSDWGEPAGAKMTQPSEMKRDWGGAREEGRRQRWGRAGSGSRLGGCQRDRRWLKLLTDSAGCWSNYDRNQADRLASESVLFGEQRVERRGVWARDAEERG